MLAAEDEGALSLLLVGLLLATLTALPLELLGRLDTPLVLEDRMPLLPTPTARSDERS